MLDDLILDVQHCDVSSCEDEHIVLDLLNGPIGTQVPPFPTSPALLSHPHALSISFDLSVFLSLSLCNHTHTHTLERKQARVTVVRAVPDEEPQEIVVYLDRVNLEALEEADDEPED